MSFLIGLGIGFLLGLVVAILGIGHYARSQLSGIRP